MQYILKYILKILFETKKDYICPMKNNSITYKIIGAILAVFMLFFMYFRTICALIIVVIALFYANSCNPKPDELFYKNATILEIQRDDESQYHLLVRYSDGLTESISDVHCKIMMGNYVASAKVPFVRWDNGNNMNGILPAYRGNSTKYNAEELIVYLPVDYKIPLFND